MFLFYTLLTILILEFAYLPSFLSLLGWELSTPTSVNKSLVKLLNFRFKLIALSTFNKSYFTGKISKIFVYPLKSCSYLEVPSWEVNEYGLKFDRQFMLAFLPEGQVKYQAITARNCPRLSLVKMNYSLKENWFEFVYPSENGGYDSFRLPCEVTDEFIKENLIGDSDKPTELWGVNFESLDIGKALPKGFIKAMKLEDKVGLTLLYTPIGKKVLTYHPEDKLDKVRNSQFQDYYPLHILTQEAIDDLNARLRAKKYERQVEAVQFRPNLVLSNVPDNINPDEWYQLYLKKQDNGETHKFSTANRCPRCSIPNVELDKGSIDKKSQVTKVLHEYRRIDLGDSKTAFFGHYLIHHDSGYTVNVGDEFYVTENRINTYKDLE